MNIAGKVFLKKGKEHSVARLHPWIFSGALQKKVGDLTDGCWVEVADHKNDTVGFGHYQEGSITVRLLLFGSQAPGESFWSNKINEALQVRTKTGLPSSSTNAMRLVHGEGDGLAGLIIDVYDGVAIVQAHSAGMHNDRHRIAEALTSAPGSSVKAVYYKSQSVQAAKGREIFPSEYLYGQASVPHTIVEHGHSFLIDWEHGQKTGFFLDQRENRLLLKSYSNGKRVLNTFCYTGGFSVYALGGNALVVDSVDVSEKAVETARKNLVLNGFDPEANKCVTADTFDFLKEAQDKYDLIVLDPPAFAKHRDARHQAVRGYQRLNAEAMKTIRKGGILFTFSCSQVVDRQLFYNTIVAAAIQAGRQIRVLQHLSQPADHPVSIFHPEGEYLKGLVLFVE